MKDPVDIKRDNHINSQATGCETQDCSDQYLQPGIFFKSSVPPAPGLHRKVFNQQHHDDNEDSNEQCVLEYLHPELVSIYIMDLTAKKA
jgi:hypothetical protein